MRECGVCSVHCVGECAVHVVPTVWVCTESKPSLVAPRVLKTVDF